MDREKVIKKFADYVHYFKPYCIGDIEDHAMLKDVLELLKEQEDLGTELTNAVELIHKKNERIENLLKEQDAVKIEVKKINGSGRCGRCPNCLIELNEMDYPYYCGYCGKAVKWK